MLFETSPFHSTNVHPSSAKANISTILPWLKSLITPLLINFLETDPLPSTEIFISNLFLEKFATMFLS